MARWLALLLLVAVTGLAHAEFDIRFRNLDDPDEPKWAEGEVALPTFPGNVGLIEFSASVVATNRFFIDGSTLSVGKDGVVRYVLIVKTPGGATNVTFEGIRCATGEHRLYASGRADGTWANARQTAWRPIENKPVNRHHAALNSEFFCVVGIPIANPEEGREALRLGRNPQLPQP